MAKQKITPLMQQYFDIKQEYQDTLLFFQVGDFYELFFEDAKTASSYLAITLTKRGKSQGKDIPLCGVPIHAVHHYLKKLIKGGFKVAMCDQLSKPQPGTVVKRGVTQVFTPGTLTDSVMLDDKSASYLMSFFPSKKEWGLLFTELLTAQIFATTVPAGSYKLIEAELIRFAPDEIVLPNTKSIGPFNKYFKQKGYCASFATSQQQELYGQQIPTTWLEQRFNKQTHMQLQLQESVHQSLGVLYQYLARNQAQALEHFNAIQFYKPDDYLMLDPATQKNLEIVKNNHDGGRTYSLFSIVDKAKTAMGSRTIKKWLQRPLISPTAIVQRQEVIALLVDNIQVQQQLEELLVQIPDLERIIGRIALRRSTIQDYIALKNSLGLAPKIKQLLIEHISSHLGTAIAQKLHHFTALIELLTCALNDDTTNGPIKKGFDLTLDRLKDLVTNSRQAILELEQKESIATGITSLKIRYNHVTGYYIEITNPNLKLVPERYKHQQTLSNRKRFITPELTELEREITQAQTEINQVEQQVYDRVKQEVEQYLPQLRQTAQGLSYLDGLYSLAHVAYSNNYVQPQFNEEHNLSISGGRHPVIETTCPTPFTSNNTILNNNQNLLIITGPNMGGKSTYLRQVALICILAQCGSFVCATTANLPILDRIFTRIGSADNLAEGKSTFLVEMEETATICTLATQNSLVILDEVGRGTSTTDGVALAHSIIEYIHGTIKSHCLFATHYHELTQLEEELPGVKNFSMQCKKIGNTLHFLHTIAPGIAQHSFGIDVAKLAQLPPEIIRRAQELLEVNPPKAASNNLSSIKPILPEPLHGPLIKRIAELDLNSMSPKKAFDALWELQTAIKQEPK